MFYYDVYIYGIKQRINFLLQFNAFLKENNYNLIFYEIRYDHGPHLQIVFSKHSNTIKQYIKDKLTNMEDEDKETIDYTKYEKLVKRVIFLKKDKNNPLPLFKNYTLNYGKIQSIEREKFPDSFLDDKHEMTNFLIKSMDYYYSLPNNTKSTFLLKLMIIFPKKHLREGIFYSYYSFKSHYEGFKKVLTQMNWEKDKFELINKKINIINTSEKEFIFHGFSEFLKETKNDFCDISNKDKIIFKEFKLSVYNTRRSYEKLFNDKMINIKDKDKLKAYLNQSNEISDYHKKLKMRFKYSMFDSQDFVVGRLMMNWFYSILPFYSLSTIDKYKLCHLICLSVENYLQKDENEMLDLLEHEYSDKF